MPLTTSKFYTSLSCFVFISSDFMEICLCNSFPSENPLILLVSVQFSIIFFLLCFCFKETSIIYYCDQRLSNIHVLSLNLSMHDIAGSLPCLWVIHHNSHCAALRRCLYCRLLCWSVVIQLFNIQPGTTPWGFALSKTGPFKCLAH